MAESPSVPAGRARYIAGIHWDLDELKTLVNELLNYARFDRTAIEVQLEEKAFVPLSNII